ncbi:hypothetical protein HAX54_034720 [Datura stramonium]|uniref:Uncharacterized protein n=1 Tax=Datura stramonium TaxID=4076 RepID=A0ABS8VEE7_DATST|nr:hypothetical protein [Datura stramonium]
MHPVGSDVPVCFIITCTGRSERKYESKAEKTLAKEHIKLYFKGHASLQNHYNKTKLKIKLRFTMKYSYFTYTPQRLNMKTILANLEGQQNIQQLIMLKAIE